MILKKNDLLDIWVQELGEDRGHIASRLVLDMDKDLPVVIDTVGNPKTIPLEDIVSINGYRVDRADSSGYLQDICDLFKWCGGTKAQVLLQIERLLAVAQETQKLLLVLYPRGATASSGQFVGILRLAELIKDVFKSASEMPKGDL